jgi:hypothetical protein
VIYLWVKAFDWNSDLGPSSFIHCFGLWVWWGFENIRWFMLLEFMESITWVYPGLLCSSYIFWCHSLCFCSFKWNERRFKRHISLTQFATNMRLDFHKLSTIFNFHLNMILYVVDEKLYWNAHCLTRYVVIGLDFIHLLLWVFSNTIYDNSVWAGFESVGLAYSKGKDIVFRWL